MKINTKSFKDALQVVKPALAVKEIIEQTTSFCFIDGSVVAYNDEICIVQPLPDTGIHGVIKAEELFKFLVKVKETEFDISTTENEIQMKAGRSKVGFALNKEITLPLKDELIESGKWKPLPKEFIEACKFALASASSDMSDPKLTCIHITKEGVVEATNNFRLVRWQMDEPWPMPTTLIPATSIREVVKLKPTKVSAGSGWVHFKNKEGGKISCRTFDEVFVNTEPILARLGKLAKMKFPDGLVSVLEKAEVFTQEQKTNGSVTLVIKEGRILVKSESLTAWFKETIVYSGKEQFSFSITPYLLKDILKETNECGINSNVIVFKHDNWTYLTSLMMHTEE